MTDVPASKTILVASSKGGVGKSTVALNLAHALRLRGLPVLLIDCDFQNRALDLMLGCENDILFDLGDLIDGYAAPVDILQMSHGMWFTAAPSRLMDIDSDRLLTAIGELLAMAAGYRTDARLYTVIDTSGSVIPAKLARFATHALIVSGQSPVSVRAAERTGELMSAARKTSLIINNFDFASASRHSRAGIFELIDTCRLPLIGVIPHDETLSLAQEAGVPVAEADGKSLSARAFENIAERLTGSNVPLLRGTRIFKKRRSCY